MAEVRIAELKSASGSLRSNFSNIHSVFLDRDGILNRKLPEGRFVVDPSELELLPGAPQAVARLNASGRKVIVVTNQRHIAWGAISPAQLARLHDFLNAELAKHGAHLDAIYCCPHDPSQFDCRCRKPAPGLFEQAFRDFPEVSAEASIMIGDSLSDVEAGRRLGMRTIFVNGDPPHQKPGAERAAALADAVADSLEHAVERLLLIPSAPADPSLPAAIAVRRKVLDLPDALACISDWRRAGNRIVFTNGCFDILHSGHLTLLRQCRELGERVVVGLNSDASIRKLKGSGRPIFPQRERASLLAALEAVDIVLIFNDDTPLNLIRAIRPDVLVKGGDYSEPTVVGAHDVKTWGGRLEIVPVVAGFSTTCILQRIQRQLESTDFDCT